MAEVESTEVETSKLTLYQKLNNAKDSIVDAENDFKNYLKAESFIKNCLVPENMKEDDAKAYIKYELASYFKFKGSVGNKMITDLTKLYSAIITANRRQQLEKAIEFKTTEVKNTKGKTVNDRVQTWGEYIYPEGYEVKEGKIVKHKQVINYKTEEIEDTVVDIALTPFILCGRTEPKQDKPQYFTIRYATGTKGTEQKEFIATISDLLDTVTMQRVLTGHGIAVTANQKNDVNEYIGNFIHQLQHNLKIEEVTIQNGWNEDFTMFAIGKIGITAEGIRQINTLIDTEKHVIPFVQKGSLEEWVKGVQKVLEYPKPRFLFYHGISSALIKILGVEQDIIDIYGSTSTGKTSTNAVISSAIANPSCKPDGYALEVGDSFNPLMAHAAGLRDLPVIYEEATGKARREAVIKAAYNLANGTDKTRSQKAGKLRDDVLEIRSNVIISCEQPISEEVSTAGGRQRIKDMENILPKSTEMGKIVNATKRAVFKNYGFFFPLYIQKTMSKIEDIKTMYEEAIEEIKVESCDISQDMQATIGRSRNIFAAKLVAGYLCEEVFKEIGIPSKSKEETVALINDMFKECVLNNPVEPDAVKALRYLADYIAVEKQRKFCIVGDYIKLDKDETNEKPQFNARVGNLSRIYVEIAGKEFTNIMQEGNFSPAVVKKFIISEGLGSETNFRIAGEQTKGIRINREMMETRIGLTDIEDNPLKHLNPENRLIVNILRLVKVVTGIKGSIEKAEIEAIFKKDTTIQVDYLVKEGKIVKKPDGSYATI